MADKLQRRALNKALLPGMLLLCLCASPLMADEDGNNPPLPANGAAMEQNEPAIPDPGPAPGATNGEEAEEPRSTAPPALNNEADNHPGQEPGLAEEEEGSAPDGVNLGELLPQSEAPAQPHGPDLSITDKPARRPLPAPEATATPEAPAPAPESGASPPAGSRPQPPAPETSEEKPPGEPAPRPGEKMTIPADAAQNNDLSFLKGCWVNVSTVYEQGQMKIRTEREYCFDDKGGGIRTIREHDSPHRICRGAFTSRFDSQGVLHITSDKALCPAGSGYYLPDQLRCTGSGAATRCTGYGRDPQSGRAWEWQADFRRK